ncbi:MAG: hypothetical protein AB1489_24825 [Acidobacteriota bacterium]
MVTSADQKVLVNSQQSLYLAIAGIKIAMRCVQPELRLGSDGAIAKFLIAETNAEVNITIEWRDKFTESNGQLLFDSGGVWQLYEDGDRLRYQFSSPVFGSSPYKVALFDRSFTEGYVYLRHDCFPDLHPIYPLEYPLDELLIMNLLANGRGAELHACGLVDNGFGYLFIGHSGAGKTTTARLWMEQGDVEVLSDDRIILCEHENRIWMYGTPWHGEAELALSARAPLVRVFFISHGKDNEIKPLSISEAVAHFFACGFPPFHSAAGLNFTLAFFERLACTLPCYQLKFMPDNSAVMFLRNCLAQGEAN